MIIFLHLLPMLLVGQSASPAPPAPFTAARFREHVAYLASDELAGRAVASPGAAKAGDYIIRHLKSYGAAGLDHGDNWFRPFPYATQVTAAPQCSLVIGDGPALALHHDFSPSARSPSGAWEGELIFVGYGISAPKVGYDDFAGVELRGKLAVALLIGSKALVDAGQSTYPDQKWEECERRGASALLLIAPDHLNLGTEWQLPPDLPGRRIPCIWLDHSAARKLFPKSDGNSDPLAALEKTLSAAGKPTPQSRPLKQKATLHLRMERTALSGRNILGVIPGKGDLAKEAILVSAHHDHLGSDPQRIKAGKDGIYNGADDNASGCAAVLLLAEALHADRERLPASHRAVIFASFDAEEAGLIGSRYYVTHPLWPLERTAANLNFDMVGRLNRGKLLAMDSESSSFLSERCTALATSCGLRLETRLSGVRRSDHVNFLDREIPAVHFCSGMHEDYHQVTDEIGKIDSEGGARISWLAYRLLRETMETPGRLRYRRPTPAFDVQSILQLVFKLGIIPEENAQPGRSAPVRFVLPGSLAAKHGLKAGDEITGVNGERFERIEDAALLFGRVRLDHGLRLEIQRAGKRIDITVPAEAFKDFAGPTVRPVGTGRFEVSFRYKPAGKVQSVALAGTFNNWDMKSRPMTGPDKEGVFTTRLELGPGVYEYKFVLDGKTWQADPINYRRTGQYSNSVLIVGD